MRVEGDKKLSGDVPARVSTKGYDKGDAALVAEAFINRAMHQTTGSKKSLEVKVYGTEVEISLGETKKTS